MSHWRLALLCLGERETGRFQKVDVDCRIAVQEVEDATSDWRFILVTIELYYMQIVDQELV